MSKTITLTIPDGHEVKIVPVSSPDPATALFVNEPDGRTTMAAWFNDRFLDTGIQAWRRKIEFEFMSKGHSVQVTKPSIHTQIPDVK